MYVDVCHNLNLKFKVAFQVKNSDSGHFGKEMVFNAAILLCHFKLSFIINLLNP